MKVIQSTYSLEWFISRLPSIYPSYNGSDEIVYFDEKSINDRHGEYTSNYGMIPLNVPIKLLNKLKKNKDYELNFGYNLDEDSYLSWNTLSEWYSFFQNYYHILNNSGSCNRVYSSATDFYDAEYNVSSVELPLGSDRNSYKEYDLLFKERGGYGFFKFINDYIVPSFEIPSEYKEYWHTYRIFYPDIIKWISWFENKKKEYDSNGSSETPIDCAKSDNCCACEEYIQRGGYKLLESFKMWYKEVNEKIDAINNYVSSNINDVDLHFKPYAFKEIPIFNSFEKTCLQSNFSEEYDVNVDYRHSNGNIDNEKNTMGGTVVNVSGKTMFFKDNDGHDVKSPGSIFDKYHMERKYDPDAFTDYTDHYISEKEKELTEKLQKKEEYKDVKFWVTDEYACYGVNKDNIKKFGRYNENDKNKEYEDVIRKFDREIPLDTNNGNGWFVFEDRMLECEPIETLELENGKVIPVFRDDNTNTPFVTMGGKNIYPEFNFKDNAYRFSFGKDKLFPRNEMNADSDYSCVNNNGNIKVFETINKTNGVTYTLSDGSTITYPYSYGYIDVDDYRLCVCDKKWFGKGETGKTIATIYPFEEVDDPKHEIYEYKESESGNSITIKEDNDIKCFMSDVITGTTSSKLLELRSSNIMTDDSGNIIEALNLLASNSTNKDRYYVQPLLGEELEPLYQVGNVSSISPFSLTYKDYDDKKKKTIRYVGNIISKMEFYFCDKDGNIVQKKYDENSGTLVDDETGISTIDLGPGDKSSLNAIKPIMKAMEVYMNQSPTNVISNGLQCDITYNIGATLKMNVDENGSTTYTIDESDYGVQYTETVEFVKTKVEYYLGTDNVSYPIYIYKLKQGEGEKASFNARIDIFSKLVENNNVKIVGNYSESEGMEKYNGIEFCPTFTRAFNIGVVSLPAIESEVNIDRGNSAAFEKHLKLGEVTSFEALENYSNGYFKIMEN